MKYRSTEIEQLDNLSLKGVQLHHALKSLEWVNKWLGNHRAIITAILKIYNKQKKPLSIVDLGCGGGDLIIAITKALQKNGIQFSITGIDGNSNTIKYAQQKCAAYPQIKFILADILATDFKIAPCDILVTSHFIYHFTENELSNFISTNLPNISTAFICSELERRKVAVWLFKCSSFLLPISKLAKQDGILAIKRSFTKKEWLSVLQKSNIAAFTLFRVPFFRLELVIFCNNTL